MAFSAGTGLRTMPDSADADPTSVDDVLYLLYRELPTDVCAWLVYGVMEHYIHD
jgi:hypothetical protein